MKADRAGAILALALGFLLISQGVKLPPGKEGAPGPGFFPVWIGVGLMALSLIPLIRPSGGQKVGDLLPRGNEAVRVAWVLVALILYAALLKPLGFIIATFSLFLILLQFYRRGRWWVAVALSLAAVLGSYWLFARFFEMPLPEGLLAL
jgi:putative tricarboxylic transport membrane protein